MSAQGDCEFLVQRARKLVQQEPVGCQGLADHGLQPLPHRLQHPGLFETLPGRVQCEMLLKVTEQCFNTLE